MKTLLKISLISNVCLLAAVAFIYFENTQRKEQAALPLPGSIAATTTPSPEVLSSTIQNPTSAEPASFCWKQLYAPDYHDYVRNLRAAGCPESTIRAIVAADVHAAYSVRAYEIEKQLSGLANSAWTNQLASFKEEAALKDELRGMPEAEAAEAADLLGLKPATAETVRPSRRPSQPPVQPAAEPLVFQKIDASTLNLTDEQKQAIANIQQDFLQQVGGTNEDSGSPAYLARWRSAQSAADDMLQATLGYDTYAQYQLLAAQKSFAGQTGQE